MRVGYVNGGLARDPEGREHHWPIPDGIIARSVYAPTDAPAWANDPNELWIRADARERHPKAQHARTIDITLPRDLPPEAWPAVAAMVFAPLAQAGMVWDVTVQNVPAADGGMNPHLHATGTMRTITADGFGLKERSWNSMFRCIHVVRTKIANAINQVAACHGLDPLLTADANWKRDLPAGEPRLPRWVWHDKGEAASFARQVLDKRRETRAAFDRYDADVRSLERKLLATRAELDRLEAETDMAVMDDVPNRFSTFEPVPTSESLAASLANDDPPNADPLPTAGPDDRLWLGDRPWLGNRPRAEPAVLTEDLPDAAATETNGASDISPDERMSLDPSIPPTPEAVTNGLRRAVPQAPACEPDCAKYRTALASTPPAKPPASSSFAEAERFNDEAFFDELPGPTDHERAEAKAAREREKSRQREAGARLHREHRARRMAEADRVISHMNARPLPDRANGRENRRARTSGSSWKRDPPVRC